MIFLLTYNEKGRQPEVKKQRVELALNGSDIRDTYPGVGDEPRHGDHGTEKKALSTYR